jgi:hypothetical protein
MDFRMLCCTGFLLYVAGSEDRNNRLFATAPCALEHRRQRDAFAAALGPGMPIQFPIRDIELTVKLIPPLDPRQLPLLIPARAGVTSRRSCLALSSAWT